MRRTIGVLVVVALLAAAGFWFVRQRQASQEEIQILRQATAEVGTIAATVNATGTIEPEAMASLSFGVGGTVQQVNVNRGQFVNSGDVLATLDTGELALAVQQAQDALRIQELTLQQALTQAPSPATLAAAQADITAAEGNLLVAQGSLASAEAALDQAEAQRAQLLAGPTDGQIASAELQVTQAEVARRNAEEAHNRTLDCFTVTLPTGERREECPGLGPAEEQARAALENAIATLDAAQRNLADLLAGPGLAEIQAADAALAAAEAQITSAEGSVLIAEANVAKAEAARDLLLEGAPEETLAILEAQVASAETSLALAELRLRQAMIVAPIDGRIASVRIHPGEQAAPGAPAITILDEAAFHIEVNVDEIDIEQIVIGQEVEVTLDALPEETLRGRIADIAPAAVTSGVGLVSYQVTINIADKEQELRPGMTASASIVVEEIEQVLMVPNWAIRLDRETGRAFVNQLMGDGSVEEVAVETGLRNEQVSQVILGLAEGDVVVVTDERETFSLFGN